MVTNLTEFWHFKLTFWTLLILLCWLCTFDLPGVSFGWTENHIKIKHSIPVYDIFSNLLLCQSVKEYDTFSKYPPEICDSSNSLSFGINNSLASIMYLLLRKWFMCLLFLKLYTFNQKYNFNLVLYLTFSPSHFHLIQLQVL